MIPDI